MKIVSSKVPGAFRLAGVQGPSREAKLRLKWMDHYASHGENASLTCRYFGISRQTFYRWKGRYDPRDLSSLESRSHVPRRRRHPTWSHELAQAVLKLREQYPRWGKECCYVGRGGRCPPPWWGVFWPPSRLVER